MKFNIGIALLTAFSIASASKDGVSWGYGKTVYGPEEWGRKAPLCNGKSQSPIDIVSSSAQENASYKSLELTFHNRDGKVAGILSNNGHAPTLLIDKSNGSVTLKGGPLGKASYILEQFHFHFGCDNNHGSEHTVDGTSYPSEMHFVFYNSFYSSFQEAAPKPDGLAVIGVFLQVDGGFSQSMENIAMSLGKVKSPNAHGFDMGEDILLVELVPDLASKNAPYYTYKGSLTTPPCYESVQWILMKNPASVTESELVMMRSLVSTGKKSLCNNFRPVNPTNGRKLFLGPKQGKLAGRLLVSSMYE